MNDSEPDPMREAMAAEILQRMADDVSLGNVKQLSAYLDQFPDYPSLVCELYAKVVSGWESTRLVAPDQVPGAYCPKNIGGLKVLKRLAEGGQGYVFLAEDARHSVRRYFVVKVLRDQLPRSEKAAERLMQEARMLAELRHDNICRLHDMGWTDDERPYLVLDYIEGESLISHVRAPGRHRNSPDAADVGDPDEIGRRVRIVETVARALHYAHQKGIIHRDVKPSNIMVRTDGSPVLIDFGLARRDEGEAWLTATFGLGTPPYMSPEQITGSEGSLDHCTDIWSLGVTLYVLLTGHLPFAAHNPAEVHRRILNEEPLNPRRLNASISRDLQTIVGKAMEKDRRRRYASAAGFADDLRRSLKGLPVRARRPTLAYRSWRWAARNRALATSATIIVLGLTTGSAVVSSQIAARFEAHRKTAAAQEELRLAHLDALFQLGRRHAAAGDWPSAVGAYRQAIEEGHPDPVAIHLELMLAHGVSRNTSDLDAVAANLQAIETEGAIPARHRGRYLMLQGYLMHDRLRTRDAGVDLLRDALERDLSGADREFCRAFLAEGIVEVTDRLEAAIALDPAHRLARELQAATLVLAGDLAGASRAVGGFRSLYPRDEAGIVLGAFLHARSGDTDALEALLGQAADVLGQNDLAALRSRCAFIGAVCGENLFEPIVWPWPFPEGKLKAEVYAPAMRKLVPLLLAFFRSGKPSGREGSPSMGFLLPPAILRHYEGAVSVVLDLPGLPQLLRLLGAGPLIRELTTTPAEELLEIVRENRDDALLQVLWAGRCIAEEKFDDAEEALLAAMAGTSIMDLGRISAMLACLPPFLRCVDAKRAGEEETAETERQRVKTRITEAVRNYKLDPWQYAELSSLARLLRFEELAATILRLAAIAEGG